jgi:hypothetical protein
MCICITDAGGYEVKTTDGQVFLTTNLNEYIDTDNRFPNAILEQTSTSSTTTTFSVSAETSAPTGLATYNGTLYVIDSALQVFNYDYAGTLLNTYDLSVPLAGESVRDITMDGDGNFYVNTTTSRKVYKFDNTFTLTATYDLDATYNALWGIAWHPEENLIYMQTTFNNNNEAISSFDLTLNLVEQYYTTNTSFNETWITWTGGANPKSQYQLASIRNGTTAIRRQSKNGLNSNTLSGYANSSMRGIAYDQINDRFIVLTLSGLFIEWADVEYNCISPIIQSLGFPNLTNPTIYIRVA